MPRRSTLNAPVADRRKRLIQAAIIMAGGTVRVARALGYKTAESARKFYATAADIPDDKVRDFVRIAQHAGADMTLAQARPDLYQDLTPEELGYTPRPTRLKGRPQ